MSWYGGLLGSAYGSGSSGGSSGVMSQEDRSKAHQEMMAYFHKLMELEAERMAQFMYKTEVINSFKTEDAGSIHGL